MFTFSKAPTKTASFFCVWLQLNVLYDWQNESNDLVRACFVECLSPVSSISVDVHHKHTQQKKAQRCICHLRDKQTKIIGLREERRELVHFVAQDNTWPMIILTSSENVLSLMQMLEIMTHACVVLMRAIPEDSVLAVIALAKSQRQTSQE